MPPARGAVARDHILTDSFCDGLSLPGSEKNRAAREGFHLDRGTVSSWVQDAGASPAPIVASWV